MSEIEAPTDLERLRRLLKALWRYRAPTAPGDIFARLAHRARRQALLARLERDWPRRRVQHVTGDFVTVPHPLDARGRHCLLHPPAAHRSLSPSSRREASRSMSAPISANGRCRWRGPSVARGAFYASSRCRLRRAPSPAPSGSTTSPRRGSCPAP